MRGLHERAERLRWMAVPLAAYLVVTALLPILHGAAGRGGFARHIAWVGAGCAAVVAIAFLAQAACDVAAAARARVLRGGLRRHAGPHGGGPQAVRARPASRGRQPIFQPIRRREHRPGPVG